MRFPNFWLPTGYRRKPTQQVIVDRTHPLAPSAFWLPGQRGAAMYELVRKFSNQIGYSSAVLPSTRPEGLTLAHQTAGITTPNISNVQLGITDRFSFSWFGYIFANSGKVIWGRPYTISHTSPYFDFCFFLNTSSVNVRVTNTVPTSVETTLSTTTFSSGDLAHLVGTYDGSNIRLYVNGFQEQFSAQTGNLRDSGEAIHWGMNRAGTEANDHRTLSAGIWNRTLSASEVRSLWKQPFQFLRPLHQPVFKLGTVLVHSYPSADISAGSWSPIA